MKNNYQSKAVPRGTRTIWRYLSALFLFLALGIGQMWAADLTAHTPGTYEKATGEGGYGLTMVSYDPDGAGDSPAKNYEVYYFSWKSSKLYLAAGKSYVTDNTAYCLISNSGTNTTDGIDFGWGNVKCGSLSGSNTSPAAEWAVPASNSSTHYVSLTKSTSLTLKVSGYDQFSFAGRDNHASTAGKQFVVTIDGEAQTFSHSATDQTVYRFDLTTGEHTIVVTGNGTDANRLRCFSLRVPSCDDPNASIIANTSVYVNDELDLEFSSDNTNSVVYDIKKGGSTTSDASVTAGVFKATVAGTYVVTATQAKDASGHCAVEESVTITVNSKTPVSSVSISGDATAYIGIAKTLTATADQAVSEYKWEVDGVDQGVNAASFNFSAAAAGTYSVVCKARNSFNDPGEYIASSAHSITVTKLCGTLVSFTVSGGTSAADLSGILSASATPEVSLTTGSSSKLTVDEVEYTGYKMDKGKYVGVTLTSGSFKAGDVVSFMITTASNMGGGSALYLYDTKTGSNQIATLASSSTGWTDFVLTSATTGVYLYRSNPDNEYPQNPYVAAVKVTRSCETSDDCSIKSLTINGDEITPAEKVYSYVVAAASALTEVEVAYTIHPLASGSPASGFNIAVPAAGDPANTQTITVTAEDGTHSDTYTVSVSKAAAASAVVTLDALGVTGYTLDPAFDAGTLAYTITKAYGAEDPGTDKVTFTKTEEAQDVDVAYDSENHKLTVTVTAEDNTTTQDYVITINEAEAPKSLSRVLFSNGFDAFIDNANHTVKAYYLNGTAAPTATTITAGAGTAGEYAEGKITVTGADASSVDYIVTLEAVTPNTSTVAEDDLAGEFAGDEAWVKNGLLIYGNSDGYSGGDNKWYVNRRLKKDGDAADDQRVIAGWVRSYFFVGNASKFIMTVGSNKKLKYSVDGGEAVAVEPTTLEIALSKGNHMIEIVSNQSSGDCRLSAPKLVELPPTFTVTYKPGDGTGPDVVDYEASIVAGVPVAFTAPEGKIFHSWKDGDDNDVAVGDPVTADMTLTAQWIAHYAVTFNMQGHGASIVAQDIVHGSKAVKPADPVAIGLEFGGWFTEAACENEFDFETPITAATPLFAKWTEFEGCALLYPALSGEALHVGDNVDLISGSTGGSIAIVGMKNETSITYNANGLSLSGGDKDVISVTLNNDIAADTKISVTLKSGNTGSRGLNLLNSTGGKVKGGTKLGWDDATLGEVGTFSYTVEAGDGLEGTNVFRLQRNNSVYLQCIKVESCGAAITYHNLTSEVNIAGKGTVALGATSVREGYTTTAEYTITDPLYEFVNWTVSGAGASVESATANPATITVGTEDAVVTLNLQLIPVKFTVNYYDGETPMGTELVPVNENPTASEIDTDKRHFTFQGWAETDGGSVVDLNTITRTEATTVNLYAVYTPVVCPVSGTIFSMESDEAKKPGETVKVAKNGGSIDMAEYATISGGNAMIINNETDNKDAISEDGEFLLKATKEVMKIELNCVLQEGDIIRIPDNSAKLVISTSNAKTGTYQAFADKNTHDFSVTAAWAGVDDIYILYDGTSLKFTQVEVYRPALLTVSFDMKGHGSAIADIENVLEGSKIVAPSPAPTDEDYAFVGWYKENTLENEWKFDVDVVEANTTLFAKWLDKSDATLKSLKYGSTDIALEDDVFEYNIALPAATASVPALTAVTNNPAATAVVTDDDAFDEDGKATSTVVVTPEKEGAATQTYTVNFSKLAALPQVDVTKSTLWNFSQAVAGKTSLENVADVVLANLPGINNDENFNSQALEGTFNKLPGGYFQGSKLMFTVAEEGLLTIEFSGTNNHARHLQVCTGDGEIVIADWDYNSSSTHQTKSIEIPAGKITLKAFEGEGAQNARIYKMEYLSLAHSRTSGYNAGDLGTVCLEDATIIDGANLYELQGLDEHGYLAFDEILSGKLEAGKPYLFEVTNPSKISFYKQVGAAHSDDEIATNGMIGTFTGTTLYQNDAQNYYYFSGRHIWRVNDFTVNIPLAAHRCYVDMDVLLATPAPSAPAPGRRRVLLGVNGEQVATGMENVESDNVQSTKLLINGQLFILRGEKMYDATGRLVK